MRRRSLCGECLSQTSSIYSDGCAGRKDRPPPVWNRSPFSGAYRRWCRKDIRNASASPRHQGSAVRGCRTWWS